MDTILVTKPLATGAQAARPVGPDQLRPRRTFLQLVAWDLRVFPAAQVPGGVEVRAEHEPVDCLWRMALPVLEVIGDVVDPLWLHPPCPWTPGCRYDGVEAPSRLFVEVRNLTHLPGQPNVSPLSQPSKRHLPEW